MIQEGAVEAGLGRVSTDGGQALGKRNDVGERSKSGVMERVVQVRVLARVDSNALSQ